jgi:hypothetical protein
VGVNISGLGIHYVSILEEPSGSGTEDDGSFEATGSSHVDESIDVIHSHDSLNDCSCKRLGDGRIGSVKSGGVSDVGNIVRLGDGILRTAMNM